jgi:hypothetical protein
LYIGFSIGGIVSKMKHMGFFLGIFLAVIVFSREPGVFGVDVPNVVEDSSEPAKYPREPGFFGSSVSQAVADGEKKFNGFVNYVKELYTQYIKGIIKEESVIERMSRMSIEEEVIDSQKQV